MKKILLVEDDPVSAMRSPRGIVNEMPLSTGTSISPT